MKYNFTYLTDIDDAENELINRRVKGYMLLREHGKITESEKQFKLIQMLLNNYNVETAFSIYTNL